MKEKIILGELYHKEDGQDITNGTSKVSFLLKVLSHDK